MKNNESSRADAQSERFPKAATQEQELTYANGTVRDLYSELLRNLRELPETRNLSLQIDV
jgi:hypothetical protein